MSELLLKDIEKLFKEREIISNYISTLRKTFKDLGFNELPYQIQLSLTAFETRLIEIERRINVLDIKKVISLLIVDIKKHFKIAAWAEMSSLFAEDDITFSEQTKIVHETLVNVINFISEKFKIDEHFTE